MFYTGMFAELISVQELNELCAWLNRQCELTDWSLLYGLATIVLASTVLLYLYRYNKPLLCNSMDMGDINLVDINLLIAVLRSFTIAIVSTA